MVYGTRHSYAVPLPPPQIKALDQELVKYRTALKKAKGPTATNIKRRAMECLKRKKMYEQQRDQMAGQQFNIEQTTFAIDSIKDTATTVGATTSEPPKFCGAVSGGNVSMLFMIPFFLSSFFSLDGRASSLSCACPRC